MDIITIDDKQINKRIVHRRAVKRWKEQHREEHLTHRRKEYINKKLNLYSSIYF